MDREYTAQYNDLSEIGLVKGSETMASIATNLTENSVIAYTIDGTYNIGVYPYLQGEFQAHKLNSIVTFEFNDEASETKRMWNGLAMIGTSGGYEWSGWEQGRRTDVYGLPLPTPLQFAFMDRIISDLSNRVEKELVDHIKHPEQHPYENENMPGVTNIVQGLNWLDSNKLTGKDTHGVGIDLYVSVTGSDETGDGSISKPVKTIAHATHIGRKMYSTANYVIINIDDGEYEENLYINAYSNVTLKSINGLGSVIIKHPTQPILGYGSAFVSFRGLVVKCYEAASFNTCINMTACNVIIDNCEMSGKAIGLGRGVVCASGTCKVSNSNIHDTYSAITAADSALISVTGTTGANNDVGYMAYSSIIVKGTNTLAATTLTGKYDGSQIFG